MSNPDRSNEGKKNFKSNKADESASNLTQSDTCLINSVAENQGFTTGNKKNKLSKHTTSFSGVTHKGSDKSGFKQKIVNKVMSWNTAKSTNKEFETDDLAAAMEGISLSPDNSEDNLCKPDWLRARDSLENLLHNRSDKNSSCREIINSRSAPFSSQEISTLNESPSPHSEAAIGTSKTPCAQSIAKVLNWDPWDKLGRKNKRDNKRRKLEKSSLPSRDNSTHRTVDVESCRMDHTSGDEVRPNEEQQEEYPEVYEYQPYHARNSKSVDFTNEVMVVYFTGDEVVGETKEPLKKELDQQIRNKEMRKGHCPTMLASKRKQHGDDYLASWFKK